MYCEHNPVKIKEVESDTNNDASKEFGTIYLFTQTNAAGAKTSLQKTPERNFSLKSHDKLLQKYHQLRNYQVLKKEARIVKVPLFLSCNYLLFRVYYYSDPDDPLLA